METKLSPSYSHEKLENPSHIDLVDVFEDLWRHCFLAPIDLLLRSPNGDVAAMTVLCSYFEPIGSYISGNTDPGSKKLFINGFCRVFSSDPPDIHKDKTAAEEIYKHIRCGLAHEGMLSHKVNYSRAGAKAFFLTYRNAPDGSLDIAAGVVSIVVNPFRMYQSVLQHFDGYIRVLREAKDQVLVAAFRRTVERRWALGTSENIIGMTEAEFLGRA
jgi:hypothetical protein